MTVRKALLAVSILPVAVAAFEGPNAVAVVRGAVGATDPAKASAGTIRGDWAIDIGRNLVHASDSPENGVTETEMWFSPSELVSWSRDIDRWVIE